MMTRIQATSVLPRGRRVRVAVPSLRAVRRHLSGARKRSLLVQERVDRTRARCNERYGYGRRS